MKLVYIFLVSLFLTGCSVSNAEKLPTYSPQPERVILQDGDSMELTIDEVKIDIQGESSQMLAYNNSIPGPIITVQQGSTIHVNFQNNLEVDSSLHSHGLRLRNEFDGVPGLTQDEVKPGESFQYELDFPDSGVFFYHPHSREDVQQDAGLYGAFLVLPNPDPTQDQENEFGIDLKQDHEIIFLDDIEVDSQNQVIRSEDEVAKTLMGNYGNRMFINGQLDHQVDLGQTTLGSEKIITFANVANVRPFKLKVSGAKMSLISDDASAYQEEEIIDELVIAPSERYTVRLQFFETGTQEIISINNSNTYKIAKVNILPQSDASTQSTTFNGLKLDPKQTQNFHSKPIDKTLVLDMLMNSSSMQPHSMSGIPCHQMPDGSWMGDCETQQTQPNQQEQDNQDNHSDGIEWEDEMPTMNSNSGRHNVWWDLVDKDTRLKNMDIDWTFQKGETVKIRIENKADSMHPMQHPIHLHGQRFLVLNKDGVQQKNLAWNDTVLVPAGSTYDIIVEMNNPGKWMVHCHIPEHMEAGMMMKFIVKE
jgi:FtsP/CotA-like multicopper oxidase with cupredoxin domain